MQKRLFNSVNQTVIEEIIANLMNTKHTIAHGYRVVMHQPSSSPYADICNLDTFLESIVVFLALDIPFVTVKVILSRIFKRVNKLRRQKYYESENKKRRDLRSARRKIRKRSTLESCPTPEAFVNAWDASKNSLGEMLKFGGMVHDLACFVDSSLRFNKAKNKIIGRNGGIKAWIRENTPELLPKYKTIMRYHAAAVRIRQLTSLCDPIPTKIINDALPDRDSWTEDRIFEHLQKHPSAELHELEGILKRRYTPEDNLIAYSIRKWSERHNTPTNEIQGNKIAERHIRRSINLALQLLHISIAPHIDTYIREAIQPIPSGDCKSKSSTTQRPTPQDAFRIRKWKECKSWLFETLQKYEESLE